MICPGWSASEFDAFGSGCKESERMPKTLKPGTEVKWKSHGGEAHGKVVKKQTSPTKIKGHKVAASPDNPEYIVETDEGKKAAHKAWALTKE
jgi:hypothetical protein